MAEFVAEGAYAAHGGAFLPAEFGCAGVTAETHAVVAAGVALIEAVSMRPYGFGRGAFGFIIAGIVEENVVYVTVVVAVVIGKIHEPLAVGQIYRSQKSASWILVTFGFLVVPAVIGHVAAYLDGAHHIEDRVKLARRLLMVVFVS